VIADKAYLSRLKLDDLFHKSEGSPDITIAIIDGAVDGKHPDFKNTNITQLTAVNKETPNVCYDKSSPSCQHGTFITGILAAHRESLSPGMAPGCKYLVRPIFCEEKNLQDCPTLSEKELAKAVNESIDAGANIINMSIGSTVQRSALSSELKRAYDRAQEKSVLLVGASGNQASQSVNSLFQHPWVIPVSAMDKMGNIEPSSNSGSWINHHGLLAPGSNITSASAGGGHQKMTGTSVAAPFVTGTAALLWSIEPNASAQQIHSSLLQNLAEKNKNEVSSLTALPKSLDAQASLIQLTSLQTPYTSRLKNKTLNSKNKQDESIMELEKKHQLPSAENLTPKSQSPSNILLHNSQHTSQQDLAPQTIKLGQSKQTIFNENIANIIPQSCSCAGLGGQCSCGYVKNNRKFIYAVGIIKPVFPNTGLQKAFNTAARALDVSDKDYYHVFSYINKTTQVASYHYIAEQISWVLSIKNKDTYKIIPRTYIELDDIIESLKPEENSLQAVNSIIIGLEGSPQTPMDNGPSLPSVLCNQVYFFTMEKLHDDIKKSVSAGTLDIQDVIKQLEFEPNLGNNPTDRAKNYLAFRYPTIYKKTNSLKTQKNNIDVKVDSYSLVDIQTKNNKRGDNRILIDVSFQYQSNNQKEKIFFHCDVDVSEQYPFISTKLNQFTPRT
jgi:hypothetical protein